MVPRVGIEPTLLSEPDFESGASTNFTTEAFSEIGSLPELAAAPVVGMRSFYCMCCPPLIAIFAPVRKAASSDAR